MAFGCSRGGWPWDLAKCLEITSLAEHGSLGLELVLHIMFRLRGLASKLCVWMLLLA